MGSAAGGDPRERFPLQEARTRRFSLGVPRNIAISDHGRRVAFLRARAGDDPRTDLWVLDLPGGAERVVARAEIGDAPDSEIPDEERSRRERSREASSGIVRFSGDRDLDRAVVDLGGAIHIVDLSAGEAGDSPRPHQRSTRGSTPRALVSPMSAQALCVLLTSTAQTTG